MDARIAALLAIYVLLFSVSGWAQQAGSIRGMVYDKDFDVPLAAARVRIAETGATTTGTDQGNYVFGEVAPGIYTLAFSKDGYVQQVKADVLVSAGKMAEVNIWLSGDFTEMEEFVVQDVQLLGGTEAALLQLRIDSPALTDSISAELMSKAGAGDAASALKLVAGASVQEGKYAVVRGLPDRYVNSQMNGVRLPTADADKRAVQLDQFPSAAIENIQVSKTFTPDQQGDASGGAVNVVLKGIPDKTIFKVNSQVGRNTMVAGRDDFLTHKGDGVNFWGKDERPIPEDGDFSSAVGGTRGEAPLDYKWSVALGGKKEFWDLVKIGAFGSFFYERKSSFYDNGINDKYWVTDPGGPMTPQTTQGSPEGGDFKTQLFDVTQGREEVKWGTLGSFGVEIKGQTLTLVDLYTRAAEDVTTLAEDTRGKAYYFPGYDPNDPNDPGNQQRDAAPYIRTDTILYTERETHTRQLNGHHVLPFPNLAIGDLFKLLAPEFDWTIAKSRSGLYQPDKRQFGSLWWADSYRPGFPPYVPPYTDPEVYRPFKPAANFTLGNLQRVWKDISEESSQSFWNVKLPFEQWTGTKGYVKFGAFKDTVLRLYNQDSFSNFNDNSAEYFGSWDDPWSNVFLSENHPMSAADIDVDYTGAQDISAWYYMVDLPLTSYFKFIGGARYEDTALSIINTPEADVTWIPPGASTPVTLNPGDADVLYAQQDVLPSIGFVLGPFKKTTLKGTYSETVARPTFKELSPIQQQEFMGADVFIGNPLLRMSAVKNYDLRLDYTPYEGGLISLSYFYKQVKDPIEYVQKIASFAYTTPTNYPMGELSGYELEVRQDMKRLWDPLEGLSIGANGTLIDSEVTLPLEEAAEFEQPNIMAPMTSRDMTNAPNHIYNIFFTYDLAKLGVKGAEAGLFYSVRGDTLVAGAGQSQGNFVPDVYEKEYGSLNVSLSQKIGDHCDIKFQAKNLTDPDVQSVYRSKYIDGDVTKTSYKKGKEFTVSVGASF